MKIQELAIIFILIILPISLVLSAYTQYQIQTVNLQTQYDRQLTSATYDAIKAYQINAENSTTSELSNSKIRDIEASVSTFKNSVMSSFRLNGYTEEDMNNYIPALVYTMYDGFYIYSPYNNTEDNNNAEYGLKPYIPYSCRYKKNGIDIVINYSLDNYITIQGTINGEYVNESGYLIDGIEITSSGDVKYNGVKIEKEELKEYLPVPQSEDNTIPEMYSYVKINGTKYYDRGDAIIYLLNGTVSVQCSKTADYPNDEYGMYQRLIKNNNQAIQYYTDAEAFTKKVKNMGLEQLTYADAYDVDGNTQLWPQNTTKIFSDNKNNIENELSNFNQHRLGIIRHVIENNLSIAIANYNNYSGATNDFQMPKLKEDEWENITHNISLISFLQGINIGGKVYNGYSLVTNSESKEVVLENNIYFLGNDGDYHKIGDKTLEVGTSIYGDKLSAGRLNLDFKRKIITNNNKSVYYYPLKDYDASYTSVVMQDNVDTYDDIYAHINSKSDDLKKAFYTALGREREGKYNQNTTEINEKIITPTYIPTGYTHITGTDMDTGYVIKDTQGNEYVWIEVPRTIQVYPTAGVNITTFTDEEFEKIEKDLCTYTSTYRNGTTCVDKYYSRSTTGMTQNGYNTQKKKMLKSIYINGGFYVGRYETGINYSEEPRTSSGSTTQTPVIKQNAYLYNYVTNAQAQELSQRFATSGYTSSLMFGIQWDLVLKYMENKGAKVAELNTDSTNWGNYKNSTYEIMNTNVKYTIDEGKNWSSAPYSKSEVGTTYLTTGAINKFKRQNIYDFAGNGREWTLEYTNNQNAPCSSRGGYALYNGTYSASSRWNSSIENATETTCFRVALYKDEEVTSTITIRYEANGEGVSNMPNNQTVSAIINTNLSILEPTRIGWKFMGWSTNPNATIPEYNPGDTIIAEDTTLYAIWKVEEYIITYDGNGGRYNNAKTWSENAKYGTEYTTRKNFFARSGYIFKGWNEKPDGTGVDWTSWIDKPWTWTYTEDVTLYALWEKIIYTVVYNAKGGSGAPASQTKTHGTTLMLSSTIPTRVGYNFLGWAETLSATSAQYSPGGIYTKNESKTLYAVWKKITYTVAYNANGGSGAPASQTKTYGKSLTLSSKIPKRAGYIFLGWSESSGATKVKYTAGGKYTKNESKTLYAVWQEKWTTPYIPTGYTQVSGTNISNGFAVQDGSGNQYVWIEVPITTAVYKTAGLNITSFTSDEYKKIKSDLDTYAGYTYGHDVWVSAYGTSVTGLTESQYNEIRQKMLKSIYQNGGFYVGRYETGTTSSRIYMSESLQTPVIKQNVYPYVKVTSAQAQELASQFASSGYTSSLMFGVQWNLILKYLSVKGVSSSDLYSDSTSWGNYQNSTYSISNSSGQYSTDYGVSWTSLASYNKTTSARIKLTTGASSIFAKQNIYDLAGNVSEYTLEISNRSDGFNADFRGSNYYYDGTRAANWIDATTPATDNGKHCVGFRVVLYKND